MAHFVIRQAQASALDHVAVHGPLYLWSWDDSLWHEYRVQAVAGDQDNTPPAVVMQETDMLAALPGGVPEVDTLLINDSLWWKETWHQTKFHRFRAMQTPEGDNVLHDWEIAWILPRAMTEYTSGVGVRGGVYFRGQDGNHHKYAPVLEPEIGVVLFAEVGSRSYAVF